MTDQPVKTWAMMMHLAQLANYFVPMSGIVIPIVIWQLKKGEMPELDAHGRIIANWIVSALIYSFICGLLIFVFIGIPLFAILLLLSIVFPIIGGIKASDGEVWQYPLSLKLF
ncbi:MAG: DUF4870 domain-containing protein [Planctomycetes bacterium]|nr:DUF4870 domain-containing protein [Planctomycetota bacterium]